jgi:hypothetical protein
LRGVATLCCAASDVPCQTGHIWHEQSGVRPTNSPFGPVRLDARFACHAIAGAALPISEVPSLAITAEYRHMAALEQSIPNNFHHLQPLERHPAEPLGVPWHPLRLRRRHRASDR